MNKESLPRTFLVAGGVALFCSLMVSLAVQTLRPMQVDLQDLDRSRAILEAAELLPTADADDREIVARFLSLDARLVDLDSGWFAEAVDAHAYDHWRVRAGDSNEEVKETDTADTNYVPVYLVKKTGALNKIVLPVHGPGMWSTIYGYIALGEDLNTITGVTFHRHAETPGVGDRIQEPNWLATWRGKRIRDENGVTRFRVTRDASGPYEVDIISGASVTAEASGKIVRTWLGDDHLGPFLNRLKDDNR